MEYLLCRRHTLNWKDFSNKISHKSNRSIEQNPTFFDFKRWPAEQKKISFSLGGCV